MSDRHSAARPGGSQITTEFGIAGFLLRLVMSLALVLATYNPSGWSFVHWVRNAMSANDIGPAHFVAGVVLLIGWVILLTATQRSMGTFGLVLEALLFGGLVWLLVDVGLLSIDSVSEFTWVVLVILAVMLAIGLSWSHVWRRLTGQLSTDDVD